MSQIFVTKTPKGEKPPVPTGDAVFIEKSLRVLLVEDTEADAYLIGKALASNSKVTKVVRARDGVEALDLVDTGKFRPDLAIVDLKMPRKDGFSLLLELKARVTAEFPSFVLTSSRSGADTLRARKRGAVKFVTKPNTLEKLSVVVNQIVDAA